MQYEVDNAKLSLEKSRLETRKALSEKKMELLKKKSAFPFDAEAIIELQKQVESYQKGLERLGELEQELF